MAAAQLSRRSPAQISISRTSKALAGVDRARARVFFAVADRGPGLPPTIRDRLFQKFQRGDAARAGGLCLRLSIIRGFVVAQSGEIVAGENLGGGAVFTVSLPYAPHGQVPLA